MGALAARDQPTPPLALPAFRPREGIKDLTGQTGTVARLTAEAAANQGKVAAQAERTAAATARRADKLREIAGLQVAPLGANRFQQYSAPIGPGNVQGERTFNRVQQANAQAAEAASAFTNIEKTITSQEIANDERVFQEKLEQLNNWGCRS